MAEATSGPPDGYLAEHDQGRLHSTPGAPIVLETQYSVEKFYRRERGAFTQELDLALLESEPLDHGVLEAVRFLWDIERSTTGQLRDLFVGWTSKEARIDAYLTTWAYEKFWIADALKRVLRAHGAPTPPQVEPDGDLAGRAERALDRIRPVVEAVSTNLVGERIVAGQMARCLSRESATGALLQRLRDRAAHPVVDRLCDETLERTEDYIGFFAAEARARLLADPASAAPARSALGRGFSPLRPPRVPRSGQRRALEVLAPGASARRLLCREADAEVHALPGLRGPEPLGRALAREL